MLDFVHYSAKARETLNSVKTFMTDYIYPAEEVRIYIFNELTERICTKFEQL